MDLAQTALVVVAAAVSGAGLWGFLGRRMGLVWRREEREGDRLRRELGEEKLKHEACLARIEEHERRLQAVEHHHASLIPRWTRTREGIEWVNDARRCRFSDRSRRAGGVEGLLSAVLAWRPP